MKIEKKKEVQIRIIKIDFNKKIDVKKKNENFIE
jgi:hypothetical protein